MTVGYQATDADMLPSVREDLGSPSPAKYTRREWWALFTLGSLNFCTALCITLQAPFYPQEAESKGATATEYGLIFGVYELVGFLVAPVYGKYMNFVGVNCMMRTGIIIAGSSVIIFGCLDMVQGHVAFVGLSFAVRIMEALGASAVLTSSFAIVATIFPDSVATVFATLETMFGLGNIVGPTIGGLLFTVGGFRLPFFVVGSILLLDGVFIYFVLPTIQDAIARPQAQLLSYLKVAPVLLAMMCVTTGAMATGFLTATLEPHLRQFNLSALSTGLMFVWHGASYAILSPLVGRLCDKYVHPMHLMIVGMVLGILSFLLIGPAPFTPFQPQLWLVILGMLLEGASNSLLAVPAFISAIRAAIACGLPDDITTYGVVSGLWGSSYALGGFVGPSVAGALFDSVGFRIGTLFVIAVYSIMFVALTTYVCLEKRCSSRPLSGDVTASLPLSKSLSRDPSRCTAVTYGSMTTSSEDT